MRDYKPVNTNFDSKSERGFSISNFNAISASIHSVISQVRASVKAISLNSEGVSGNATDIATNGINISQNSSDIGDNVIAIGNNATAIGDNTTAIGTNATNIGNNTSAISGNAGDIIDINTELDTLAYVSIEMYGAHTSDLTGTLNRIAIQATIDAVAGDSSRKGVYIPNGTYLIDDYLTVPSDMHVLGANGAVLKAGNLTMNGMLVNANATLSGVYDGDENITIENILFDCNRTTTGQDITCIGIAHAKNIHVINCDFTAWSEWHAVEYNACSDSSVRGCRFYDAIKADLNEEAVQLDLATSFGSFPWPSGFPYDGTPCKNILIDNCVFDNVATGIGTHNKVTDTIVSGVKIYNCKFYNLFERAISGINWSEWEVSGCVMEGGGTEFIKAYYDAITTTGLVYGLDFHDNTIIGAQFGLDLDYNVVVNNAVDGVNYSSNVHKNLSASALARAVWVRGATGILVKNITCNDNLVDVTDKHGLTFDYCSHVMCANNTVLGCANTGIVSYSSSNVTISNNIVKLNTLKDIHVYNGGVNNFVTGNACLKMDLSSPVTASYIHGNRIDTSLTLSGATNQSNGNWIASVYTP